jgi:hypothetical protein
MEIQIAVAKTNKYATSESGDTLEMIERPNGGVSVVLADGQTSGKAAKIISSMVVRKVISLLADGVRVLQRELHRITSLQSETGASQPL